MTGEEARLPGRGQAKRAKFGAIGRYFSLRLGAKKLFEVVLLIILPVRI
jgi:hypothetical protein